MRFFAALRMTNRDSQNDKDEILRCAPNDKIRNCKGMNPLKLQFIFIFNDPRHECLG
jgi:hypothetical protein